jgi:hypothetical protein
VQTAVTLKNTLWGKDFDGILEEVTVKETTYKYVPKTRIDTLEICKLRYFERSGLLIQPEYDVAFKMLKQLYEKATDCNSGLVVLLLLVSLKLVSSC